MKARDKGQFVATINGFSYFIRRQSARFKLNGVQLIKSSPLGSIHLVVTKEPTPKGARTVGRSFKGLTDAYRWLTYYVPVKGR